MKGCWAKYLMVQPNFMYMVEGVYGAGGALRGH